MCTWGHAYSPAAVGWKIPSQHLNPISVKIYTFGRPISTISKPCPTQHPKASKVEIRTYHGRIAHDRDRCTTQRLRTNIIDDDGSRRWDESVSQVVLPRLEREGYYPRPGTSRESRPLCRSLLIRLAPRSSSGHCLRLTIVLIPQ